MHVTRAVVSAKATSDLNRDAQVTLEDLLILIEQWHEISFSPLLPADINGDTVVDEEDALIFTSDWMMSF